VIYAAKDASAVNDVEGSMQLSSCIDHEHPGVIAGVCDRFRGSRQNRKIAKAGITSKSVKNEKRCFSEKSEISKIRIFRKIE